MTEQGGSNGSGKVALEFDEADLGMVLSALRVQAATVMMSLGDRDSAAYLRLRAQIDAIKARLPATVTSAHDEYIWPNIQEAMKSSPTWSVGAAQPRWGGSYRQVVIRVGDLEWTRDTVERGLIDAAVEEARAYLCSIAPMTCSEAPFQAVSEDDVRSAPPGGAVRQSGAGT